jgi:hypothetical protein
LVRNTVTSLMFGSGLAVISTVPFGHAAGSRPEHVELLS